MMEVSLPVLKIYKWVHNLKKTDWKHFQSIAAGKYKTVRLPDAWNPATLNTYVEAFSAIARQCLEEVSPLTKVLKDRSFKWWTDSLQDKRHSLRAALHACKWLPRDHQFWGIYHEHLREYKSLIKKAKRAS